MKCKNCRKEFDPSPSARDMGKKGGEKSVRTISPEQQKKMQKALLKSGNRRTISPEQQAVLQTAQREARERKKIRNSLT